MHEICMWFSWKFYNNTRLFWDFRYLKINCNLSVKSKFYCRCLPLKLPKYTRHSMVEKSGRFFLMRLLLWNVKSSCPGVLQKRYSENFHKIHKKTPVLGSLFNMKLQRLQRRCFPVNFAKFWVCRTSRNCCFWNTTWLVSRKSFWVILEETVQSSHSHTSFHFLWLCCSSISFVILA